MKEGHIQSGNGKAKIDNGSALRVFVSYSGEDRETAQKLVEILADDGRIKVLWAKSIRPGMAFADAIKTLIERAHLFMPLVSEKSQDRPWVHQETGYAMALGIPVIPIAIDTVPKEMIATLQAIEAKEDLSDLADKIKGIDLENLVRSATSRSSNLFGVADWPEERTKMLADSAERVLEIDKAVHFRQKGAFSSFSVPGDPETNSVWKEYDGDTPRSDYYHYLQGRERQGMERHGAEAGCSLIIDPTIILTTRGLKATRLRVKNLHDFLEKGSDDQYFVVCSDRARGGNLTILGNWFMAESRSPRIGGYRQTVFNWHAPTVLRQVRDFESEFDMLLSQQKLKRPQTRKKALEILAERIDQLTEWIDEGFEAKDISPDGLTVVEKLEDVTVDPEPPPGPSETQSDEKSKEKAKGRPKRS